jgi:phytanoyl-CoA hydroxylase
MVNAKKIQNIFNRDGFVRIESFLTQKEVAEARIELDRIIRDCVPNMPSEHVFYEDITDSSTLKQLQCLHTYDPYFEAMMFGSKAQELAEIVLGNSVVPKNMQYFNKAPSVGQPTPAHQDGFYFKLEPCQAVTLWLALDDVDEENGCVHYAQGSHLTGMQEHSRTSTLGFSQGLVNSNGLAVSPDDVACPAKPGDLLAHHALTVH